jgi:hypothetical protein
LVVPLHRYRCRDAAGGSHWGGRFHALTGACWVHSDRGRKRMKEYQLFILTSEGCVKEHYTLKCADDADARKRAEKFLST